MLQLIFGLLPKQTFHFNSVQLIKKRKQYIEGNIKRVLNIIKILTA